MVGPIEVLNPNRRQILIPLKPKVVPFIKTMHPIAVGSPVGALALPECSVYQPKRVRLGIDYQVMRPQSHRADSGEAVVVIIGECEDPRAVLGGEAAPRAGFDRHEIKLPVIVEVAAVNG